MANFDLSPAIQEHLKRKKEDKSNIMTRIFKPVSPLNPLRTPDDDNLIVIDGNTKQILQFDNLAQKPKANLDMGIIFISFI